MCKGVVQYVQHMTRDPSLISRILSHAEEIQQWEDQQDFFIAIVSCIYCLVWILWQLISDAGN